MSDTELKRYDTNGQEHWLGGYCKSDEVLVIENENGRLKAENEALKAEIEKLDLLVDELREENLGMLWELAALDAGG